MRNCQYFVGSCGIRNPPEHLLLLLSRLLLKQGESPSLKLTIRTWTGHRRPIVSGFHCGSPAQLVPRLSRTIPPSSQPQFVHLWTSPKSRTRRPQEGRRQLGASAVCRLRQVKRSNKLAERRYPPPCRDADYPRHRLFIKNANCLSFFVFFFFLLFISFFF